MESRERTWDIKINERILGKAILYVWYCCKAEFAKCWIVHAIIWRVSWVRRVCARAYTALLDARHQFTPCREVPTFRILVSSEIGVISKFRTHLPSNVWFKLGVVHTPLAIFSLFSIFLVKSRHTGHFTLKIEVKYSSCIKFHFRYRGEIFRVYLRNKVKSPGPPRGVCTTPHLNHT